ncbi:styrene monooxygenase/indole monooxygenase family protein [Nocardia jinanensis]|uniref:Alanine-phosphoribitol ligase n=1 Tax=Nocardia jinanensis TaxID=382504 RepID=A0A917VPQ5_9NOCA|nr:styrene monooxygenase/indole monooxygenase family protein [Nocardia jinanensis]GGL01821.1 alanine-phosphoribitol ligase [Nocardia jinanensis]
MVRNIQILGAGECGLPLAHRLLRAGRQVTLVAARDADAVSNGSVTSTQVKFPRTLDLEAAAGLDHWGGLAPEIRGIRLATVFDGQRVLGWTGRFSRPAQSVDQRTVFARWLTDYVDDGGDLEIADPQTAEVDRRATGYDLTVITRASGELAACFAADPGWPAPGRPARRLAVLYLEGVTPDPDDLGTYVSLPGMGEVISYPGLTGAPGHERRCEMLLIEALPGGPLDVFDAHDSPSERLRRAVRLLESYLPGDLAERYRAAELTDAGATAVGAVQPAVRRPVGTLPSGRPVLGGGDAVCRMDPGGAQGANNAAHCAAVYAAAILASPDGPFHRSWMESAATPWLTGTAHHAARWTAAVLDPPAEMQQLMLAAQYDPALADAFAETFARPADMVRFITARNVDAAPLG